MSPPHQPSTDEDFAELTHAVWPSLYRTAVLLVGDHGLAEDLVQSSLAKTYASWGRVRSLEAAPGYARTVLVNTATSWFRRRSWRNERPTETLPEPTPTGAEDRPLRDEVDTALVTLPPRQRAAVVCCASTTTSPSARSPACCGAPRARSRARPRPGWPSCAPPSVH